MDEELRHLEQQVGLQPDDRDARARYAAALTRTHTLAACRELLAELPRWDDAAPLEQDAACAWVAARAPEVAWTGAQVFERGGQRHRIGVFEHGATGIVLHLLPGGEYLRGTADVEAEVAFWTRTLPPPQDVFDLDEARLREWIDDEVPAYRARVGPLLVARDQVTEAQWRRGPEVPRYLHRGEERAPDLPRIDTEPMFVFDWARGAGLRIPREVEWEWACRAGTTTRFFWGDELDSPAHVDASRPAHVEPGPQPARVESTSSRPAHVEPGPRPARVESASSRPAHVEPGPQPARVEPASSRPAHVEPGPPRVAQAAHANAFGLRDMVGNAHELCSDRHDGSLQYRTPAERAAIAGYARRRGDATPTGDGRGYRLRGGSLLQPRWSAWTCRSAVRTTCVSGALFAVACRPVLPVTFVPRPERARDGDRAAGDARLEPRQVPDAVAPPRALGALRVWLVRGDIAFRPVDAIVNAANDELQMGGGVAGALRSAGGADIERVAMRSAPVPLGAVVRTHAGSLLADAVYHAVVIRHDHRGRTDAATIRVALGHVLTLARRDEVESLAIPLLGAGVGGLSVARSLEAILDALEEHAPAGGPPLDVELVVLDEDVEEARAAFVAFRDRAARAAHEDTLAADYLRQLEGGP